VAQVADVAAAARAEELGSKIVVAPMELENGMVVADLTDPNGSLFARPAPSHKGEAIAALAAATARPAGLCPNVRRGSPPFPSRKEIGMTATTSPALRTALAYHQAWTSHDLDKAMSYIADDIVCDAPAGRLEGAEAYRGFMGPFVQILTSATMIAAFGDDKTALVMYDTETVPVSSAPAAEYVTVNDGKITYSRFVFDRAPFDAARSAAS
jgi:hypothetical protein